MESELYLHTTCVHVPHTHISVSGVDSRSLWGVYPWVLSDTPTECVTQCANVPSLKQNTRHHTNHALSRTCMQLNVIPFTPQGHFFQQLYHKTARGLSSLKTSSCNRCCWFHVPPRPLLHQKARFHELPEHLSQMRQDNPYVFFSVNNCYYGLNNMHW